MKSSLTFFTNWMSQGYQTLKAMECEGAITETECSKTLSDFKLNKTPGFDGFQVKFYKFFWPAI